METTDTRIRLIKRLNPSRMNICFDSDANGSGERGASRAAEAGFRAGIEVYAVTLPRPNGAAKMDVNEYFKDHGRSDFERLPRRDYIDSALDAIPTNLSPRQKYEMVKPILDAVGTQPELCWKEYVSRIANRFPEYDRRKLEKMVGEYAQATSKDGYSPFLPLAYVEKVRGKEYVIFFDGRFFKYEAGCYRPWYSEEVDQVTIGLIGQGSQSHHIESVRKFLGIVSFVRAELVNPRDKLNLANGILDLDAGILSEHTPGFISTIQSRTCFDPGAECPLWLQTVDEILPDPQSRQLLAQIFGYCLTADVSHQKGFIFYGEGSNGKSLITDVMEALLGPENCSALHLSDFKERFRLSELQNRLVNFSAEVEAKGFINDARIKAVITGDSVTAERKNQPPFIFRSFAKLIVSCNNLPRTTDKTHGYFRRWTILPFTRTFSPEKRDRTRAKRIIDAELPGVLNWAIGGYRSLTEAGTFIESVASREALQEYRREADPTVSFIEERTTAIPGSEYGTTLPVLYDAYRKWASDNGYEALGKIRFRRAVERITGLQVDRNADAMYFPGVQLTP